MSVLSDLQRSAELNRRAFAACRRALTVAEKAIPYLRPATIGKRSILPGELRAQIKGARTSMAKAERGERAVSDLDLTGIPKKVCGPGCPYYAGISSALLADDAEGGAGWCKRNTNPPPDKVGISAAPIVCEGQPCESWRFGEGDGYAEPPEA